MERKDGEEKGENDDMKTGAGRDELRVVKVKWWICATCICVKQILVLVNNNVCTCSVDTVKVLLI